MGPVPLRPYLMDGRPASKSQKMDEEPKFYAFAAYSKALDANTRRNLETRVGVRFLGVHDSTNGNVIYRVALRRPIESARRDLKRSAPAFINLERIYPEDKVTRKIFTGTGFAPGERDSASRAIHIRVGFFEDVTPAQSDSILAGYLGRQDTVSGGENPCFCNGPAICALHPAQPYPVNPLGRRLGTDPKDGAFYNEMNALYTLGDPSNYSLPTLPQNRDDCLVWYINPRPMPGRYRIYAVGVHRSL